ncbi:hypothetical protein [Nostoc sp.]|uniref:hypothetical protein n=1 Tax=Nostoc sp. TaxID=1180 RepID=UPI002FF7FCD7
MQSVVTVLYECERDPDLTGAIMPDGEVYKPMASEVEIGKQETSLNKVLSMTRKMRSPL